MELYNHFEYGELLAYNLKPIAHSVRKQQYYRATEIESLQELKERLA